jgi:hypothetical protein
MNEIQQTMLSIQEAQDLYLAEGGVEVGVKIDIFKNKRWLKCHRGLILAGWEENDGQIENFRAVVKEANVVAPAVYEAPKDTNDYPMIAAMAAIGGPGMGFGYALGDAIFKKNN